MLFVCWEGGQDWIHGSASERPAAHQKSLTCSWKKKFGGNSSINSFIEFLREFRINFLMYWKLWKVHSTTIRCKSIKLWFFELFSDNFSIMARVEDQGFQHHLLERGCTSSAHNWIFTSASASFPISGETDIWLRLNTASVNPIWTNWTTQFLWILNCQQQ